MSAKGSVEVPFLRSAYNYDRNKASDESGLTCEGESLTKQSFKAECDINEIVRRFGLTGELPIGVRAPTYGDFADVFDYHSAMNAIARAGEAFDAMPAEVRARFHNDPGEFLEFVNNDGNRDEAVKLGLVLPKAVDLAAGAAGTRAPAEAGAASGGAAASSEKPVGEAGKPLVTSV